MPRPTPRLRPTNHKWHMSRSVPQAKRSPTAPAAGPPPRVVPSRTAHRSPTDRGALPTKGATGGAPAPPKTPPVGTNRFDGAIGPAITGTVAPSIRLSPAQSTGHQPDPASSPRLRAPQSPTRHRSLSNTGP